jgi:hypothetical protein
MKQQPGAAVDIRFMRWVRPGTTELATAVWSTALFVTVYGSSAAVAVPRPTAAPPVTRLTFVRASPPTIVTARRGPLTELRFVSVEVENKGQAEAKDVSVVLRLAEGISVPLKGVKKLAAGARAVFVSSTRLPVRSAESCTIYTSCSTCRR